MSLRTADLRFVLPAPVHSARVLGAEPFASGWNTALEEAGLEASNTAVPDLIVAPAQRLAQAMAAGAPYVLLLGRPRRPVPGARQLFVRGEATRPLHVVPADQPSSLRHYLRHVAAAPSAVGRVRGGALAAMTRTPVPVGRVVPSRAVAVVHTRQPSPVPFLIQEATAFGVPRNAGWVLSLGAGDDLQRAVFHLLEDGRADGPARWVLKFARVAGYDEPFRRDEAGLALARSAGPVVAGHAPALLGRFDVAGLAASVETAASGRRLVEVLARVHAWPGGAKSAVQSLDAIASWVIDLGRATRTAPAALGPELARLAADVVPRWVRAGASPDLVGSLPPLPGVLQHNDLGSWNIVTDGAQFTAVDWESARACGLPLWDLLYVLGDCLVRIEGPGDVATLTTRALALFRGESAHSARLFGWVRRAVETLQLPVDAVGPLATLCWLHHGLSSTARDAALGGAPAVPLGHLARLAEPWLADPALGVGWRAWAG